VPCGLYRTAFVFWSYSGGILIPFFIAAWALIYQSNILKGGEISPRINKLISAICRIKIKQALISLLDFMESILDIWPLFLVILWKVNFP
jgi:hypothetical protein